MEASNNDLIKQFFDKSLLINNRESFVKKLSIPSLNYNLFSYSKTLIDYHYNLNKQFNGLDYNDSLLFETIVSNLCKELLNNNEISISFLLYEKIYEVFIEN